jgi:uncharacterized membrane protein YkoI
MRTIHALLAAGLIAGMAAALAADNATSPVPAGKGAQSGNVLSMEDIMQRARAQQPGQIKEVELERKYGRLLYEVEMVADDGVKKELKFDAKTGELVSIKNDDDD